MIDMHIHTVHSDGKLTVKEILKLAEERKLDYIAFTDHDAVGAVGELKTFNIKDYFSGKIIPGSEIRFVYNHSQMEVLAYGYDYEKLSQSYWVKKESYHAIKKALLANCLEKGKNVGLVYNTIEYDPNFKPETLFYAELMKHEENLKIMQKYDVKHSGDFFRKLIADPASPMYFDPTNYSLSFDQAVDLIHSAGGVAVLAHPFGVYRLSDPKKTINELIATKKLDGLECYHSNILPEQTQYLLDLCKKHDLISTGGSDYHNYPGQFFAKANYGKDDIPTKTIDKLLQRIDNSRILNN